MSLAKINDYVMSLVREYYTLLSKQIELNDLPDFTNKIYPLKAHLFKRLIVIKAF